MLTPQQRGALLEKLTDCYGTGGTSGRFRALWLTPAQALQLVEETLVATDHEHVYRCQDCGEIGTSVGAEPTDVQENPDSLASGAESSSFLVPTDWRGIHNDEGAELLREVVMERKWSTESWMRTKAWAAEGENQASDPTAERVASHRRWEQEAMERASADDARMDSSEGGGGRLASNLSSPSSSSDDASPGGDAEVDHIDQGFSTPTQDEIDEAAKEGISYGLQFAPTVGVRESYDEDVDDVPTDARIEAAADAMAAAQYGAPNDFDRRMAKLAIEAADRVADSASPGPDDWSELLMAAKHVVLWDWSDNDSDAYSDILRLRNAVEAFHSNGTPSGGSV